MADPAPRKKIRLGDLLVENAFGTEQNSLPLPAYAQYFDGNTFVINTDDSCSTIALNHLTLTTAVETVSGTSPVRNNVGSAKTTTATISNIPLSSADPGLVFGPTCSDACTDGNGDVLTTINLGISGANLPWLRYDRDNDGVNDNDPSGTASFGLYRGDDRIIYQREVTLNHKIQV